LANTYCTDLYTNRGNILEEFFNAFVIGFVLCAPLGPIGIFCARRALIYGKLYGIVSILGASITDAFYCAVTAFGIGHLSFVLSNHKAEVRLFASVVLIAVGVGIYFMKIQQKDVQMKKGLWRAFFSTILLTLTNPIPILVFAAAFTATGILSFDGGKLHTALIVIGVFAGSAIWSPIFGSLVTLFRSQSELKNLLLVNRIAGIAIGFIGLIGVFTTLPRLFFLH
jgi:threonine/homoserine/homoserine lactone efflux protein